MQLCLRSPAGFISSGKQGWPDLGADSNTVCRNLSSTVFRYINKAQEDSFAAGKFFNQNMKIWASLPSVLI